MRFVRESRQVIDVPETQDCPFPSCLFWVIRTIDQHDTSIIAILPDIQPITALKVKALRGVKKRDESSDISSVRDDTDWSRVVSVLVGG
jgi:hypothetical protein